MQIGFATFILFYYLFDYKAKKEGEIYKEKRLKIERSYVFN